MIVEPATYGSNDNAVSDLVIYRPLDLLALQCSDMFKNLILLNLNN